MKVYLVRHRPLNEYEMPELMSLNEMDLQERLCVKKLNKQKLRIYRVAFDERMGILKNKKCKESNEKFFADKNADLLFVTLIDNLDLYIKIRTIKEEREYLLFLKESDTYLEIDKTEYDLIVSHRLKLWKKSHPEC